MADPKDSLAEREAAEAAERRLAKQVGIVIPVGTVMVALGLGVTTNIAPAVLALTAGALMGTIALLWASLRTLGGDAPLPESLEQDDETRQGDEALLGKKTMLLRALKDLENERSLGKITAEDFDGVAERYRAELKDILKELDAQIGPYREKAEALAAAHLEAIGKPPAAKPKKAKKTKPAPAEAAAEADEAPAADAKAAEEETAEEETSDSDVAPEAAPARRTCPACNASNEVDAKFCKECAAPLVPKSETTKASSTSSDNSKTEGPAADEA